MLRGVLRTMGRGRVAFWCPGCTELHQVAVGGAGPCWGFNGDYDRPTFEPSVLVRGHRLERDAAGKWTGEWLRDDAGSLVPQVCHSFVRNGRIQFLGDCTHALAGQAVDLQPPPGDEP
jgi:hypothetical protein